MNKISFKNAVLEKDLFAKGNKAIEALAEGRLPGKLGVCQDIIGYWAEARLRPGVLQYCRAGMSTAAKIMSYIESKKQVNEQNNTTPTAYWLIENNYNLQIGRASCRERV